jgi:hypothetical protein
VATYDQSTQSIWIQTDSEDKVGVQRVIVRNCDSLDRLLELNLYINVLANTHPDFVSQVETSFTLTVGQPYSYKLPAWSDPENNDVAQIYVAVMEAQETKYPPFLLFENSTNTITFRPIDPYSAGQTYFFSIVIKELHSSSVMYSYYCTVKMTGDIIVRDTNTYWVNVNYTITQLTDDSQGYMNFTEPVNMTYLRQHFFDMFDIYWHDIDFRDTQ